MCEKTHIGLWKLVPHFSHFATVSRSLNAFSHLSHSGRGAPSRASCQASPTCPRVPAGATARMTDLSDPLTVWRMRLPRDRPRPSYRVQIRSISKSVPVAICLYKSLGHNDAEPVPQRGGWNVLGQPKERGG